MGAGEDNCKKSTSVGEDHSKLLTENEHKKLFDTLDEIKSTLKSLSKSTEEPLPDTNESSQAKNDLPKRIEQQVEDFLKSIDGKISELNRAAENFPGTVKDTGELQQKLEQFTTQKDSLQEMFDAFAKNVQTFKDTGELQQRLEQFTTQKDSLQEMFDAFAANVQTVKDTGELQQRLEQFTTQKDSLQEMFDAFAKNVQTFKETTEHQNTVELEQLKKQRDDFKSERDSARGELQTKTFALDDKQRELESIRGELQTKTSALDDKQRELDSFRGELRTKTTALDDKQRELDSVRGELRTKTTALDDKQRELDSVRGELQTKTAELGDKQRELDSARGELQTKTAELGDKQRELDSVRGEVKKFKAQAEQANESVQSVKNIFNAYEPVLAALKNCSLFSEYVNEHDLTAGDSKALFRLARKMGETSDFASEIHSIAVEAKKNSKEPMTAAEGKVYKTISRCYAEIWNIDFDIFICPGEQSTDKPYTTTNFNRSDMINLLDPRDKVSKYAQEVYVPLLRTKNRGLISQARVKAGNDMK